MMSQPGRDSARALPATATKQTVLGSVAESPLEEKASFQPLARARRSVARRFSLSSGILAIGRALVDWACGIEQY